MIDIRNSTIVIPMAADLIASLLSLGMKTSITAPSMGRSISMVNIGKCSAFSIIIYSLSQKRPHKRYEKAKHKYKDIILQIPCLQPPPNEAVEINKGRYRVYDPVDYVDIELMRHPREEPR